MNYKIRFRALSIFPVNLATFERLFLKNSGPRGGVLGGACGGEAPHNNGRLREAVPADIICFLNFSTKSTITQKLKIAKIGKYIFSRFRKLRIFPEILTTFERILFWAVTHLEI